VPTAAERDIVERLTAALTHWSSQAAGIRPTSQVTGGGAIAAAEAAVSRLHGGRPAVLLPSATYALRVALTTLEVRAGDEVLLPAIDWPASWAAVSSLGAKPVPVHPDPATLTISPAAAGAARTRSTRAVIACHLHGIAADVPALRHALPGLPVIEDCAQALGSSLDGAPTGTLGDIAVFSFGPGKQIDAGEAGMLLAADDDLHRAAILACAHPVRQLLSGVAEVDAWRFSIRPHPAAALLAVYELARWSPRQGQELAARTRWLLADSGASALGDDPRRTTASSAVPVLVDAGDNARPPPGIAWARTGAQILCRHDRQLAELHTRVRLATLAASRARRRRIEG
jgi:hypothetical protein